ncbi:hypothetical protein ACOZ38_44425 [Sphaerisporangium viridialbum]|uniref:hypothetical protein n=1 Tax=Sphaerisporangium viridialbum TaxID=46189 RepID=UPI003C728772
MGTDTARRTAFIAGLRDLAAFIEANPAIPVPTDPAIITYYPAQATDAALRAEVDRIATLFGTHVDRRVLPHGLYATARRFGPVHYEATAILSNTTEPPHEL